MNLRTPSHKRQKALSAAALLWIVGLLKLGAGPPHRSVPPPQVRGRFSVHRVSADEAKFKLCRVKEIAKGAKGIPYMVTHDGRTIRYPDPALAQMDTVKLDLETGKVSTPHFLNPCCAATTSCSHRACCELRAAAWWRPGHPHSLRFLRSSSSRRATSP